jgi:hypothetical protein
MRERERADGGRSTTQTKIREMATPLYMDIFAVARSYLALVECEDL